MDAFLNALQAHNWSLVTGFVLVFLVHAANKFGLKAKIGSHFVPAFSVLLGIVLSVGNSFLFATHAVWYQTLSQGFLAGASATGLWELVGKHVLGAVPGLAPVISVLEAVPPAPTGPTSPTQS